MVVIAIHVMRPVLPHDTMYSCMVLIYRSPCLIDCCMGVTGQRPHLPDRSAVREHFLPTARRQLMPAT